MTVAVGGALALWLLTISPFVGSFLGVLVIRLPRGQDVLVARSRCAACGTRLSLRDLVPLLSFLALSGRCRHCGAPIPRRLPLVEGLSIVAALASAIGSGSPAELVLATLWLWLLVPLAVIDAAEFRLPDVLTGALLLVGVPLGLQAPVATLLQVGASAALGAGVLALVRWAYRQVRGREGLGLGDVKLMAGIGAALPIVALPWVTLLAAFLAIVAVLARPRWRRSAQGDLPLPFGTFLCLSAALVWLTLGILR